MSKYRIGAIVLVLLLACLGYFMYTSGRPGARFPFKYGLDLIGGTELVYHADVSKIAPGDVSDSMNTLRDVIERRINIFGVSEPLIQVEDSGIISGNPDHRLIVELPGVTNIDQAVAMIGQTPLLEFRLEKPGARDLATKGAITASTSIDDLFTPTGLTGALLQNASLQFNSTTKQPYIVLNFNSDGTALFAKVTSENIGKVLAIILDGQIVETPVIQDAILNGTAQITGSYTPEQASAVVRQLNYGALPVPISLASTETIGASLGSAALTAGLKAGLVGFAIVVLFLIFWYRLPGLVASISLVLYILISLSLFRLVPVTLTAAGLAGFILSIGMAVDANILIFERMKEELRRGKKLEEAMHEGFHRAWLSIRDSNISSIITAVVLFWLGTAAVKGFALTLGIGVAVSMFTAITASRTFLFASGIKGESKTAKFLFGSGISSSKNLTSNN
jgi:protein-export membrane protein SecD